MGKGGEIPLGHDFPALPTHTKGHKEVTLSQFTITLTVLRAKTILSGPFDPFSQESEKPKAPNTDLRGQ